MHHNILTLNLKYIGKKPFAYKAQDYKTYTIYPQDTISMPKNHFATYLLNKPSLFVLADSIQEKDKEETPQPNIQEEQEEAQDSTQEKEQNVESLIQDSTQE